MDGHTVTFDLFALKSIPTELYQLLTNPTIHLITWDSNAEYVALTNTLEPLSAMRISVDVAKIWETFRNFRTLRYLDRVGIQTGQYPHRYQCLPFDFAEVPTTIHSVSTHIFGKCCHIHAKDSGFHMADQWSGEFLATRVTASITILDIYLALNRHYSSLKRVCETIEPERELAIFQLLPFQLPDQSLDVNINSGTSSISKPHPHCLVDSTVKNSPKQNLIIHVVNQTGVSDVVLL